MKLLAFTVVALAVVVAWSRSLDRDHALNELNDQRGQR